MKKKIDLVLKENVENLGIIGDEVSVALGYARNHLLPKNLVLTKKDPNYKKILKQVQEKRQEIEKEIIATKEKITKAIDKIVVFKEKASEQGKLFGSVTAEKIAEKIGIDKKYVIVNPIKIVGEHKIKINLFDGTSKDLVVKIEAEESKTTKIKNKK